MPYAPSQVASYYAHLFAARQDVYSEWVQGLGWRPVREPLTPEVVLAGLQRSGPAISGFLITPDSTSHVAAIDYDTDIGLVQATELAGVMANDGIPAYVETSRRGGHLWCILDRAVPAVALRAALRGLLQAAGQPDDPHIELRPGSDTIKEDGLGHALRMPWMPHPLTRQAGVVYDAEGTRLGPTIADGLLDIEWASADRFLAWGERWVRPQVTHIPTHHRAPYEDFPDDDSLASDLLRELWGVPNATPGRSVRCPAHDDKHASLSILADDKRAICKAGYCILNNEDRGRGTYELRKMAPFHG